MEKAYLDYCTDRLGAMLAIPSPSGYTGRMAAWLLEELTALGYRPRQTVKGGVFVDLGGGQAENNGAASGGQAAYGGQAALGGLVLCSHVDTLGAMVHTVKPSGRLRVTPLGGLDPANTFGENVVVHTRDGREYTGAFQLENASIHVNADYKEAKTTFQTMEVVLDERVSSPAEVSALGVGPGDIVSFEPRFRVTASGYIKSRFLDDKLSSAVLLAYAKYLADSGRKPARQVYLHFTVYEEVGHGASGTVPAGVTELLAVDMGCVGEGLSCDETMVSICAKDSQGPSTYEVVTALAGLAKEKGIPHAVDVYPFYGSDADGALRSGYDIRHCTMGPGVYASHGYERSHVEGVAATFDLLCAYSKSI